jgi:lipoyl(octanoyl) transferase
VAEQQPLVKWLGRVDYLPTSEAMLAFNRARHAQTRDEIWICEHPPVYTLGVASRSGHVLDPQGVPVVQTDRGGQVTYHGPGQIVAYPLIDLRRLGVYVKEYVYRLEHCVIKTLEAHGVTGHRVAGAPGIYVRLADPFGHAALTWPRADRFGGLGKIAALGIKVSRHCSYHGVALNVAMDLRPFYGIDPCGYKGLRTVDMATLGLKPNYEAVGAQFASALSNFLSA